MTAAFRRMNWSGYLLGFSLGGFFDGILLHQILQWHHLLSRVESTMVQDIRVQILADGLFHAFMYVIGALGLFLLWKSRTVHAPPASGRLLWGNAMIGFGAWHVIDAVLSHWILGIHRVRDDSLNPLFWDLLWLIAFGILPLVAGWWFRRSPPSAEHGHRAKASAALALAVAVAAPISLLPSGQDTEVLVLFSPWTTAAAAFQRLADVDARILWTDPAGKLWAVQMSDSRRALQLYQQGAWLVSNSVIGFGCFSWMSASRIPPATPA